MKKLSIFVLCMICMLTLGACGSRGRDSENEPINAESVYDEVASESEVKPEAESDEILQPDTEEQTADGSASEEPEEETEQNQVLVVYFSHTGTTKAVAEYLHELVGGDLVELEPVNAYPAGYSDALDPAKREQHENARPEIKNSIESFDSYEVVYLGYPIWWGTTPMLINTFLEAYDFTGKTVAPFATSGGTGIGRSIEDIRNEVPDADVKNGLLVKKNDDILPWLQELGMYE